MAGVCAHARNLVLMTLTLRSDMRAVRPSLLTLATSCGW
jgi:hypothetical protein